MSGLAGGSQPIILLLIEQDPSSAKRHRQQIERCGQPETEVSIAADWDAVTDEPTPAWDVVVFSCVECNAADQASVRRFKQRHPAIPVIVLSAMGSLTQAVGVMRLGADDFVTRPATRDQLMAAITRALRHNDGPLAGHAPLPAITPDRLLGTSRAMVHLQQTIERAASSKATVFLKGESGTGKELCAEAVHAMSPCAAGPMVSINCSAIPRELMESEIFGHEKGAFTGAAQLREGAAQLADGGTLFLDEICEMDLSLQAKLLRFIQTGQFMRVGGSKLRTVDVRFVCATNKDPMAEVRAGSFRADLFYRLHVLPVILPPLREREQDVLIIARHALKQYSEEEGKSFRDLDHAVEKLILNYWWPGNVRELLNVIRNVVVMNDGETVTANMIPLALAQGATSDLAASARSAVKDFNAAAADRAAVDTGNPLLKPLWMHEQEIIEGAVAACGGNIGKAAAHLDINPSTIYRKRQIWAQHGAA